MKKMKRNRGLSLLLAVVMTLSVLSGGLTAYAAEYEGGGTAASAQGGEDIPGRALRRKRPGQSMNHPYRTATGRALHIRETTGRSRTGTSSSRPGSRNLPSRRQGTRRMSMPGWS